MKIYVDNKPLIINEGERNLLEALRTVNIEIPNLCYLSEASVYGACRMCLVQVNDKELSPACVLKPYEGIRIRINTPDLYKLRKGILELVLASHKRDCPTCERSSSCKLQKYSEVFGIRNIRYDELSREEDVIDPESPIVHNNQRCILCGDCVRVCHEIQGVGAIDFAHRGFQSRVSPAFNKRLSEVECVYCGQCVAYCPTGALSVRNDLDEVFDMLKTKNQVLVAMIAPAVRVAISEEFSNTTPDMFSIGKITAFLRSIGFNKIYDVTFGADLVAYEEALEFSQRLKEGKNLPQFTSCCPAWVKFVEEFYPQYLPNLSTVKSPQQAMGSLIKKYLSTEMNISEESISVVSIMPCSAKKFEASRNEFNHAVNLVLTTTELAQLIRASGRDLNTIDPEPLDKPFGLYSSSGLSFGRTGGVVESVVKVLSDSIKIKEVNKSYLENGIHQTEVNTEDGKVLKALNIYGLGNAKKAMELLKKGMLYTDIIEVMSCNYGCIGGGGQPYPNDSRKRDERTKWINDMCKTNMLDNPQENPYLHPVYTQYLKEPLSKESHELIHTHYNPRRRVTEQEIEILPLPLPAEEKVVVKFCLGTSCYMKGSYNLLTDFIESIKSESWANQIEVVGTFCTEKCDKSPNIIVNNIIISEANINKVREVVSREIRDV